ncbi:MAG: hypothetical protein ACM3Q1_15575 [Bacteroidales bacterium]
MSVITFQPRLRVEILFAGEEFMANGRKAAGMPLVLGADGALHEGASSYFLQKMGWEGATAGSMRVEGYVLKDWLQFLEDRGIDWREPTDNLLSDWASDQAARGKIGAKRINDKLGYVFAFYHTLQTIGVLSDIVENPLAPETNFDGTRRRFPISAEEVLSEGRRSGVRRVSLCPRVRYHDPAAIRGGRRYTPDEGEVEAVLDHLLGKSAGNEFARVRNFLCARVMANMGLRREGAANLTTTALESALAEAGIHVPVFRPADAEERAALLMAGWIPWLTGLDAIAAIAEERNRIIDALADLERQHRRNLFVTVVEKGRKKRVVPLPIRLMRSLLVEWVWDQRVRFIAQRRSRFSSYMPPTALWLSRKTGKAMTMGAIANEMKTAFNTLEINASGHRLRAYFLTELVRDLYLAARAAHGRMFDARTILDQAAEIAGHSDPASLKPYLSRVMKEDTFRPGEPVLVENSDDAVMLRALAEALATGDDQIRVPMRKMLAMLLERFQLSPVRIAEK